MKPSGSWTTGIKMAEMLEGLAELLLLLCRVVYYWLEAIVMAFVPTSVVAKDISGQTVLITGAGQ